MIQYFPIVTGSLTVLGNINVSGSITTSGSITISGSITSASFATSASNTTNAISASYANNLTVAGTLTAQTLVVQTITSSVIYSSGSNVFGNSAANTQVFTGSVYMNPGGLFVSSSGLVGIGTSTPTARCLTLYGTSDTNRGISFRGPAGAGGNIFLEGYDSDDNEYCNFEFVANSGNGLFVFNSATGTNPNSYTTNARMIIRSNGYVGINNIISSTNYKLGVSGSAYFNGTNNKGVFITDGASYSSLVGLNSAIAAYNDMELRASGTDYQLYLTTSGKVGIGTNNPTGNLTVKTATNFNLRVDSYLSATCIASVNDAANAYAYLNIDGNVVRIQGLNTGGNVCIGTTTDFGYKLNLNGQPGCNGYTAWTNWSDSRLKENITDLDAPNVLNRICTIRPVTFNYNELSGFDEATRARRISGFIAQELMEVFPDMVNIMKRDDDNEYYDTNLSNLNLYLVKAIQELNTKFEEYKATHP